MDYKALYEQSQKENEELKEENEELKVEAKKIEEAVRSSRGDALERCLPIWYGEDKDEDDESFEDVKESEEPDCEPEVPEECFDYGDDGK